MGKIDSKFCTRMKLLSILFIYPKGKLCTTCWKSEIENRKNGKLSRSCRVCGQRNRVNTSCNENRQSEIITLFVPPQMLRDVLSSSLDIYYLYAKSTDIYNCEGIAS